VNTTDYTSAHRRVGEFQEVSSPAGQIERPGLIQHTDDVSGRVDIEGALLTIALRG
jgi:hypothetical protein